MKQHVNVIIAMMGPYGNRMCHAFKLLKGRSFNIPSPQSQRGQRELEAQHTQLKQTPLSSK